MNPDDATATFFDGDDAIARGLNAVPVEIDPETYSEYYDLVTDKLFKTTAEEGFGFLERYIERKGSFFGLGSIGTSLRKHSYLREDIGKSYPTEKDRIEESLLQLRDKKRKDGSLTLDDVVATAYLLPDEFDRRATFLLAYELGYLEPQALGVSDQEQGKPFASQVLQWMDTASSKDMPLRELLPKIHFFLRDGPQLYTRALEDITQNRFDAAETKLLGLRSAATHSVANLDGPITYQLAQIALKRNDTKKAEERLREAVMLSRSAFPARYGVQQEDAYRELIALYQRQKKTPEALWALGHLGRYYAGSKLLGTHKKYIEDHAFVEGKTAFAAGNLEAAVNCFVLETTVKPKNAWAWYYLGRAQHKRKKTELAKTAFSDAIALRPAFATQDYDESVRHFGKKDYAKALWAIERAGEIAQYSDKAPRQRIAETANKIGAVFKDGTAVAKDYTAATRAFTAALAADATNADAHYHIGTIAFMQKKYDVAQQAFLRSLSSKPKHAWAFYQLGRTYDALKRTTEAQAAYNSAAGLGHTEAKKLLKK